jgi:hypothetical protein
MPSPNKSILKIHANQIILCIKIYIVVYLVVLVTNIPDDQRSLITLAKVEGLVGKVTEIDEKAKFRVDYVRLRIAYKDISKVPKTAEGVLGLTLYDFGFEREILEESNEKTLKSG